MRFKFTIAICALLVMGLAVSEVAAQGYRLAARVNTVAASGNNQEVGSLRLTYKATGNVHIPSNNTLDVTFGGLTITSLAATPVATSGSATVAAAIGNIDDDNKNQKVRITLSGAAIANDDTITLTGVRVDVSGLDADSVRATVTSTGSSGDYVEEDTVAGEAASIKVSNVMDGLAVTEVGQISVLTCDAAVTGGRMPSIKLEEGFASAWETDALGAVGAETSTQIRIVVANVPAGVTFRWPGQGNEGADGTAGTADDLTAPAPEGQPDNGYFAPPAAHTIDHDGTETTAAVASGSLSLVGTGAAIGDDKTKHWAVYSFSGTDIAEDGDAAAKPHNAVKNVFTVSPMVMVDTKKTGMGGVSDVWAQLWPMAKTGSDDDRATVLSYDHAVETKDMGYFVNVTECVTYLLFPFLTCGAQADWTTGIAVANTSADDEVFPVNAGAAAQGGSVMIHAYPKSTMAEKTAAGHNSSPEMLADPISATISGNLAAGDTVAVTCNAHPMLAGFEGYGIVRAGFRHAHGMAFVLGNFMDGAAIDVAHGYIALVIPDPEFAGEDGSPIGRGAVSGESLSH
ncbi:MAG: hypothetical protein OXG96_07950 [Acidobacteria bacterium]|nr:hypothetical protein [Acidobacteriota bacterium]